MRQSLIIAAVALTATSTGTCKRETGNRAARGASTPVVARSSAETVEDKTAARVRRARATVRRLKMALKAELQGALPRGPVAAIDVCQLEASTVTAAGAEKGITVGRTSDRPRNPENAPEPWMRPVLDQLRAEPAPAPGNPPAHLTVNLDDGRLAYAEAIHIQPLCTTCHGTPDSTVAAALAKRYPEDKATGYEPGAFRGLFWAVVE